MAGPMDFLRNNNQGLMQLGLGLLSGRTGQEQAAMGAQGLMGAINQNRTLAYLDKINPALAEEVRAGRPMVSAWEEVMSQRTQAAKPKNFGFQKLDDGTYGSWDETTGQFTPLGKAMKPVGADGADEYGLNPQYGVDANGNPVIVQLSKSGTSKQTALPDGVTLSKEPIKLDAGTHFVLLDPITRQPIGQIQKDLAGAASQKVQGEAQGGAVVALPGARSAAQRVGEQVESLANDPYLPSMLGSVQGRTPDISENAARVRSKMDQLQGGAFLEARQLLKGGGAITDYEGQKAEQAFARLNRAQNEADYKAALDDFNYWVQQGVAKLEAQAAGGAGAAPAAQGAAPKRRRYNPQTGTLE